MSSPLFCSDITEQYFDLLAFSMFHQTLYSIYEVMRMAAVYECSDDITHINSPDSDNFWTSSALHKNWRLVFSRDHCYLYFCHKITPSIASCFLRYVYRICIFYICINHQADLQATISIAYCWALQVTNIAAFWKYILADAPLNIKACAPTKL